MGRISLIEVRDGEEIVSILSQHEGLIYWPVSSSVWQMNEGRCGSQGKTMFFPSYSSY
jgi:hypothetical protein